MSNRSPADSPSPQPLALSGRLARAETVTDVVDRTLELAEATFDDPTVRVCAPDAADGTYTTIGSSAPPVVTVDELPDGVPTSVVEQSGPHEGDPPDVDPSRASGVGVDSDPSGMLEAQAFVPVGPDRLLCIGVTDPDGFEDGNLAAIEAIGTHTEQALARIDAPDTDRAAGGAAAPAVDGQHEPASRRGKVMDHASALRELNGYVLEDAGFGETVDRLLSLGCEYFGLDTGILSHVDGVDYEVEAVVDATGSHEAGAVYELGETMCDATLASEPTDSLAFADVADTEQRDHPAAANVRAYIAAPVVVGDETYGTVNFSMRSPREQAFTAAEREFVTRLSQWLGSEIEDRRRFQELERYETILEAVDDPVYALDASGRFTFVNEASERQFGYGPEVLGKSPSVGMTEADVAALQGQIEGLVASNERSTTAEIELETPEGERRIVENRLALIGDDEFRGTAGVLRDVTARKERQRQLESFQRAIESARDGVAILDGDEYTYVDQTHVDMYGFDDTDQLLGHTWRELYDEDEAERLEGEAFPALESDGYWRGMVTGSRPDGSTFPAELSLTIVEDGRLVCTVRDETERRERERELELKEQAMNEATVGIQITDPTEPDNQLVYVNDGFEQMTGYSREEVLGQNPRFLQGDVTDPEKRARLRDAIAAEEPVSLELQNIRKDGTPYWSRLSVTPVTDDGGDVRNYIGIQQDVTERHRQQRELEDRQRKLDLVLSNTDTSIAELDVAAGTVHWDEMLGDNDIGSPSTLESFIQAVHPDDRERLQANIQTMLEAGQQLDGEYRLEREDGDFGWVAAQAVPVLDDGDVPTEKVVAIATEITDLKEREQALEESQERYRTLLEAAPDPVIVADTTTGDILEVNAAAEELLGRSRSELVGRDHTDLYPEDDMAAYEESFEGVVGESTIVSELPNGAQPELRTADGKGVPVEIHSDTVELPEGPVLYGVFRDISEREERKRELELKERAMDEANVGITISDPDQPDNPLVYVNDGFVEQTGYDHDDVLGRNCRFLQADDRDQSALDELREDIDAEQATTVELRNYGKDGEQFWNRLSVTPVYDDAGTLTNYIGIQQDVTEEKSREQRLRALIGTTRELLQTDSIEDAATSAIETLATKFSFPQAAFYRLDGDELVRTAATGESTARPPDRIERGRSPLWEAVESGEMVTYDDVTRIDDGIDRGDVTAGAYFPVGDHGVVVVGEMDPDRLAESERRIVEVLTANLAAVLDSLDREASLRASEQRYRSLAENIPNSAVLAFDADLEYRLAAGELLSEFGLSESRVTGIEAGTVFRDRADEIDSRYRAALDGERTNRRVEIGDRTIRVHIVPVVPGTGQSTDIHGLVLAQDVTEEARRERELYEERERFRLLTEAVDEYAFLVVDEDGDIQTWNHSAETMFGYDAESAVGMSMAELHPEADRESRVPQRLLQQAQITGESAQKGWRVRADGSEFYADVRYAPLEADDGEFRGYAKIVRDMTDWRRQQRRTERFVEESDDVVTIVDPDGTVTYASGSATRVLGYEPADLLGENLFDYLHPDGREHAMHTFQACIEEKENTKAECRLQSPDGEWINIEGRCRNMLDEEAIDGVLVYIRDVTESKERARRFESIFNQTFQFTGLLQPDGTVSEVNDAALEFGGVNRDAIVGERFSTTPYWTHSEAVQEDLQAAIQGAASGEFVRYETEVRGADGLATIDFSAKPVFDEDDDVSLIVVEGRDITDRIQQSQHLEVLQRVMRHNMRNDLTKLRGWGELMSGEDDAESRAQQFEVVEEILDKWEMMTERMAKIRRVIRSQQGETDMWSPEDMVAKAVASVQKEFPTASITTEGSSDEQVRLPSTIVDAVRELVSNAAATGPEASATVSYTGAANGWVEIEVRDDGPGLPEMEANVLETGEESPLNHGQGLGLWMVRVIVMQAGGEVSVESTPDGTSVRLRLPTYRKTTKASV
jgi:PAS domain S-box-containing protein